MPTLPFILIACLGLTGLAGLATSTPLGDGPAELVPVDAPKPIRQRSLSDRRKSQDDKSHKFKLQDHSQFLWLSPNTSNQNVGVSLDLFTKADEYVLDLNTFRDELEHFECSNPLTLHFKSNYSYSLAVDAWSWVNGNASRSFILVEDHPACNKGGKNKRRPWVVTDLEIRGNLTAVLNATEKTWKEVLHTYNINFGGQVSKSSSGSPDRRQLSWQDSFSIPLKTTFPRTLLAVTTEDGIEISLICDDCGTTGSLVIAGSITANIGSQPNLQVTVSPSGVKASVTLGIQLNANPALQMVTPYQKQWTIADVPLGDVGIVIPDLLTIGPNLQINGGVTFDNVQGAALIESGVTATIPDDSSVSVDLVAKQKLSAHGWVPTFSWNPLSASASVNASMEIYLEAATAISFLLLNSDGFQADVALRLPDWDITAETLFNSNGVCKGSKQPLGVRIDSNIGAELVLEGYAEVGGDEEESLNVPLFNIPKLITLPTECVAFDNPIVVATTSSPKVPAKPSSVPEKPKTTSGTDAKTTTSERKATTSSKREITSSSKPLDKPTSSSTPYHKTTSSSGRKVTSSSEQATSSSEKKTSSSSKQPEKYKSTSSSDFISSTTTASSEPPMSSPSTAISRPADSSYVTSSFTAVSTISSSQPPDSSAVSTSSASTESASSFSSSRSISITSSTMSSASAAPTSWNNCEIPITDPDELQYLSDEAMGESGDSSVLNKRQRRPTDPTKLSGLTYNVTECDRSGNPDYLLGAYNYPGPTKAVRGTKKSGPSRMPLINLKIGCGETVCTPDMWDVSVVTTAANSLPSGRVWASEHIYERNWVRDYMNYLYTATGYFRSQDVPGEKGEVCEGLFDVFLQGNGLITTDSTATTGTKNYMDGMMQTVGTDDNWWKVMAIFPQQQNGQKFSMFAGDDIDAGISDRSLTLSANERACRIGMIVSICEYMKNPMVLDRLTLTVKGMQDILTFMDKQNDVTKLTPSKLVKKTYASAHIDFFQAKYNDGFKNARERLAIHAQTVLARNAAEITAGGLDSKILDAIKDLSNPDTTKYCQPSYNIKTELKKLYPGTVV